MAIRMNDAAGYTGAIDSSTGAAAAIIGGPMPLAFVTTRDEDLLIRFGGASLTAASVATTATAHDRLVPANTTWELELPIGATKWAAKARTGTCTATIQFGQRV